ncbi:hypothetical protein EJ06DRAFT_338473 [Trichodelitschia bisporula]|uniref:Cytochrome b561 domain-containing protein n=1 Tax=Trichodelitschia bisporula TaxID=703511 RepID=A0A6G1I285_9PEZI|nr:hypothetical protein EJ06DRAFT_338473 [Trichodelitschia bisporula]
MASATGIPEDAAAITNEATGEQEPLLGRAGDASQQDGKPLYCNLILGTGVVAQFGVWILVAIVWAAVFSHDLILFSAHPLLNSAGLLFLAQGALVLQPTHTAKQKRAGTLWHAAIMDLGIGCFIGGLAIIEYNKHKSHREHFESPHSILGIITYLSIFIQGTVGFTQYFVPQVYGGVENAKKVYKFHRIGGYVIYTLGLATVAAATQTDYNKYVLGIQLWAVIVTSVIILAGVVPRIKKQKLGL